MDCGDFRRVDAVFVDDSLARQVTHGDNMVSVMHTVEFDSEHRRVYVAARAVEVGGVYVNHQRLARHLLGVNACGICKPVMGVDDVELLCPGNHSRHY